MELSDGGLERLHWEVVEDDNRGGCRTGRLLIDYFGDRRKGLYVEEI